MAEKKITKRENFNKIKDILMAGGYTDLAGVMAHELTLLDNKVGKKSEKVSAEQKSFDEQVFAIMTSTPSTVTEIYTRMGKPDGVATPRITASLKRLVSVGKVVNTKDGKKSLYTLA